MSKKFIWRHFVDNVEVSKDEFLKRLEQYYLTCDTNYDNPLLNVCFVDEKATQSKYDSIKRRQATLVFIDDEHQCSESFRVIKEMKKHDDQD